ncbi:flagellar basal-body rod protein FlgF [Pigmentiphaga aceris]|uniref:Flagellar basal-body rod protein FlgF n=1 Tax=Pigmentiphaga aceris TaxID=1940612 RepID=A0A5C0AXW8_9BURK|nr:flagellar basal-body rod protein FlgF [Pigmentiphaga aceris]QEI07218.1 flagellar basal-body rod protein FlgF [Pigmentiphaga aceris]
MDRSLFIAATGTRELMRRQDIQANNLANASTPGFRAELAAQRTAPVSGGNLLSTRAYAVESASGADLTPGAMMATGRTLDVAIQGDGWLAVQTANGAEAYSRGGSLAISQNGQLVDAGGRPVVGEGGAIAIPPDSDVDISHDGTITAIALNDRAQAQIVGRIKLVNPTRAQLSRGEDGVFRSTNGQPLQADNTVRLAAGMVEGSNVNAIESMVNMISSARHFEMQTQFIENTKQNQQAATQLLSLT